MSTVKSYLSLIKFSHTIFAMPFAMIGFFLAFRNKAFTLNLNAAIGRSADTNITPQKNYLLIFILVILCMIFARSAAMAFNRYLDRAFDARNPRTAIREIPAGIVSSNSALRFVIVCCLLFITCTFFINRICFYLSPLALFVVLFYSYTKRFTALCHIVLGIGLSLAPIGAYLAVNDAFAVLPVLFSFAVIFWVSGFDIIYAMQDEEFDRSNQLYSMPASLGKFRALRLSEMLHLLSAACVIYAGFFGHFGISYWLGTFFFSGMLIYQHSIVKPNDLRRVNIAFMTANGIASVVFAVFVLTDIFIKN